MILFLLACPKPPPVVDHRAVVDRDGLLDSPTIAGARAPYLASHSRVELDGAAPEELLLHTIHPRRGGAWEARLFAYRIDETGSARRLSGAMVATGAEGRGDVIVADLDGDGASELVITGGTDGHQSRSVSIFTLSDDQLVDAVWSTSPGAEILVVDADGDGRQEVIGLTPDGGTVRVSSLVQERGVYRPAPVSGLSWLPAVLTSDLAKGGGRADPRTAHLLTLALDNGLRYRGEPGLQVTLEERYAEAPTQEDRAVFVDAMAWVGDPGAIFFLRGILSSTSAERPLRATGRTLGMLGDQEGLITLIEEMLLAGRYEPELLLGALEGVGPARIAPLGRDRTIEPAIRARLVSDLFAYDAAFSLIVRDLLTDRRPELAVAASTVLESASLQGRPAAAQWLALFPTSDLKRPLSSDVVAVRRNVAAVLARKDEPEAAALLYRVLEREDDATARQHAVAGLRTQSAGVEPERHLTWLAGPAGERRLHHRLIGERGDAATVYRGLRAALSGDDLAVYAEAFSGRTMEPEDEDWAAVGSLLAALALQDTEPGMRQAACAVMGVAALPETAEALAEVVATEPEPLVLAAAAAAIGKRGLTEQVDVLLAALPGADSIAVGPILEALVILRTPQGVAAVAEALAGARSAEADAAILSALEHSAGIATVRAHVKALLVAEPVDCARAGSALLSLVRAGDGATDDVVADLDAACPGNADWLIALIAVWATDPLLAVQIRPLRDHPDRMIRIAAEQALTE
ncbi:MAG: HEAT repeat domain-containing protein [Myxococcota bacterium]|nr:HEAT repeat domain-containing protein [Myxococcota bacterium]